MAQEETKPGAATSKVQLVSMTRPKVRSNKNGPTTANVHPAEVENYEAAGWSLVKETK